MKGFGDQEMKQPDPGNPCHEPPLLRFQLLGVPMWHLPGRDSQPLSRKDAALVAILALDGPQARDVLSGRIWPDGNDGRAAVSLRQRVARLRRDTGHPVFHTGQSVRLADDVIVDAGAVGRMDAESLLGLGDLLAGFDYADNELVNAWVAAQRELLRRIRSDALAGHAHRLESRGELAAALRLNDCIVRLMPLQEHAWRHQMRLHYLRGDRSSAILAFEQFEARLRDETGARPSEETLELLRMIEAAQPGQRKLRAIVPASLIRPPRLVGRDPQWRAMSRAWSAGKSFLLLGEAGMGKSRLLAEFMQGRSGTVFEQGRPGDAKTPRAVLARLLENVLQQYPFTADALTSDKRAGLPDFGSAATGGKPSLWRVTERMLAGAMSAGLSALVVDDLHLADRATVATLRWLSASSSLAGLRFGLAARPPADARLNRLLHDWLDDSHRHERIVLSALTVADIAALIDSLDVPELASAVIGERLFRHAGGQPFFTLETLKDMLLQGHDPATDALPAPATVRTLLEQRIGDLSVEARDLLRVAAVAGPELTVRRAAQLLGRSRLELATSWAELESANLLQGHSFACELVRIGALQQLPQVVQCVLHAELAELLAGDPDVAPGRVAEHWEAAGRWNEAAACSQSAAAAARRRVEQMA